jgi:hypothetical protein
MKGVGFANNKSYSSNNTLLVSFALFVWFLFIYFHGKKNYPTKPYTKLQIINQILLDFIKIKLLLKKKPMLLSYTITLLHHIIYITKHPANGPCKFLPVGYLLHKLLLILLFIS